MDEMCVTGRRRVDEQVLQAPEIVSQKKKKKKKEEEEEKVASVATVLH